MSYGSVYVLTNNGMPHYVKIGCSVYGALERAKNLSKSSTPFPFKVAFEVRFYGYRRLEKAVHKLLAPYRVNEVREFFRCTPSFAEEAIRVCAELIEPDSLYVVDARKAGAAGIVTDRDKAIILALSALPVPPRRLGAI
jgi:hypothetical protein